MTEKKVLAYCKENLLLADIKECVVKGKARVEYASEKGVLIAEKDSDIYMFACEDEKCGEEILFCLPKEKLAEKSCLIVSHGIPSALAVRKKYPLKSETPCYQVVYEKAFWESEMESELNYHFSTDDEIEEIIKVYDRESPQNLRDLHRRKQIISAYNQSGEWVGFIGRHPEGSMGLLLIFPEYRRNGYAYLLEGHLIEEILKEGRLPYAHIVEDNEKSIALQKKLGFSFADEKIIWHRIEK